MQQSQPLLQPSKWRMGSWFVASLVLMAAALLVQHIYPGSVVAVTLYKAHLMVLGGWGGYWLDRALFPRERALIDGQAAYATYWQKADGQTHDGKPLPTWDELGYGRQVCWQAVADALNGGAKGQIIDVMPLRRAAIMLGCLLCVGLGA